MLVCVLLFPFAHETAGAARTRSSLRPSCFGGERICKPRANAVARMRTHVQDVAHMTEATCGCCRGPAYRGACCPARIRATGGSCGLPAYQPLPHGENYTLHLCCFESRRAVVESGFTAGSAIGPRQNRIHDVPFRWEVSWRLK